MSYFPGLATPGGETSLFHRTGSKTLPDVSMESLAPTFDASAAEDELLQRQNGPKRDSRYGAGMREMGRRFDVDSPLRRPSPRVEESPARRADPQYSLQESTSTVPDQSTYSSPASTSKDTRGLEPEREDPQDLAASALPSSRRWLAVGRPSLGGDSEDLTSQQSIVLGVNSDWELNDDSLDPNKRRQRDPKTTKSRLSVTSSANESTVVIAEHGPPQLSLRQQEAETNRIKKENFDLKFELEMLRTQLVNGVGVEKAKLIQKVGELQRTSASLKTDISKYKKASKELNDAVVTLQEENENLRAQAGNGDNQTEEWRELEDRLQDQMEARKEAEAKSEQLQHEMNELRQNRPSDESMEQIETDLTEMRQQLEQARKDLDSEKHQSRRRVADLEAELAQVTDQRDAALEDAIDVEEFDRLRKKVSDLESEKMDLESQLEQSRKGACSNKDAADRDQEIQTLKTLVERLRQQAEQQEQEVSASDRNASNLAHEIKSLKIDRQELEANLAEAMTLVEEKEARYTTVTQDLEAIKEERNVFKRELAQADQDIDQLTEARDQLAEDLVGLEKELDEMKASSSPPTQPSNDSTSQDRELMERWRARAREYETMLREAGELVKTEKHKGKERIRDLQDQLRFMTSQRDALNVKAARLESIMNAAAGLGRKVDPDAL